MKIVKKLIMPVIQSLLIIGTFFLMFLPCIYRLPGYQGAEGSFYTGFEAFYGIDNWFNVSVGAILIIIFFILIVLLTVLRFFLKYNFRFYINIVIGILLLASIIFFILGATGLMLNTTTLASKQYLNEYYLAQGPYISILLLTINLGLTAIDEVIYRKSIKTQPVVEALK